MVVRENFLNRTCFMNRKKLTDLKHDLILFHTCKHRDKKCRMPTDHSDPSTTLFEKNWSVSWIRSFSFCSEDIKNNEHELKNDHTETLRDFSSLQCSVECLVCVLVRQFMYSNYGTSQQSSDLFECLCGGQHRNESKTQFITLTVITFTVVSQLLVNRE